ncbi:MAG: DUF3379 family protein [Pseudomonadota bacterium]
MNCLEFRRLRLAEPDTPNEEADAHVANCPHCQRFWNDIRGMDGLLKQAFAVPVPDGFAAKILLNHSLQSKTRRPTRWQWLSLAATFIVAITLVLVQTEPASALAEEVLTHVLEEQGKVQMMLEDVSDPALAKVLESVDQRLRTSERLGRFRYARNCIVNGQLAAHLVMEDGDEQINVMLIPNIDTEPEASEVSGHQVYLEPIPGGVLAVVAEPDASPAQIRRLLRDLASQISPVEQSLHRTRALTTALTTALPTGTNHRH